MEIEGAYKITHVSIQTKLKLFFESNLGKIEYVYLLGKQVEHWLQVQIALEFYDECCPIVWQSGQHTPITKGKGIKLADILLEHRLTKPKIGNKTESEKERCDIAIAENCYVSQYYDNNDESLIFDKSVVDELLDKRSKWHFLEIKQLDCKVNLSNVNEENLNGLISDVHKMKEYYEHAKYSPGGWASMTAVGFYRFSCEEKIDASSLERDLHKILERSCVGLRSEVLIKSLDDESVTYALVFVYDRA
jgi:hypothetical protein